MKEDLIQSNIANDFAGMCHIIISAEEDMSLFLTIARSIGNQSRLINDKAGKEILETIDTEMEEYNKLRFEITKQGDDPIDEERDYMAQISELDEELKNTLTMLISDILVKYCILR